MSCWNVDCQQVGSWSNERNTVHNQLENAVMKKFLKLMQSSERTKNIDDTFFYISFSDT